MSEATPFALSKLFTHLTGHQVSVSQAVKPLERKATQLYGEYVVLPWERALVVEMDLSLLSALGGALLGLPSAVALQKAQEKPMDALVQDAIQEVLNVASAVLSKEGRVVFRKLVVDRIYLSTECTVLLTKASVRAFFQVAIDGRSEGFFSMMTNL